MKKLLLIAILGSSGLLFLKTLALVLEAVQTTLR